MTPPSTGLQIDEVRIPGDVNVFVPAQLIQTDERYWVDAKEFVPERWGERRGEVEGNTTASTDRDNNNYSSSPSVASAAAASAPPYFPFSMGPYSCPGKNLAIMSLRITLSRVLLRFSVEFAEGEGEDGEERFEREMKDTFTTTLPPLKVRFRRR